jgi:hypothetical protein
MLSSAKGRIASAWPDSHVEGRVARLENVASTLAGPYDLVVGSLSLHHMLAEALGPHVRPLGIRTALATPHADLFALHLGRPDW